MANDKENILEKARERGLATPSAGFKVPDGYFDDFNARMAAMLPERPEIERPGESSTVQVSFWTKIRPYVYMAAMFAGVWCMLQMLHSISGGGKLQPMTENAVLAEALSSDEFIMDYISDNINSWDIVDEMMEDGAIGDYSLFDNFIELDDDADYILPQ